MNGRLPMVWIDAGEPGGQPRDQRAQVRPTEVGDRGRVLVAEVEVKGQSFLTGRKALQRLVHGVPSRDCT